MGRLPTGRVPQHDLKLIRGKHREIMRRLIAGESQKEIAIALGMTQSRISIIVNSPLFKREYEKLEQEVQDRFKVKQSDIQEEVNSLQPDALKVLKDIIQNKEVDGLKVSLPLKRDTALDILALGGNSKNGNGNNGNGKDSLAGVINIISQGFALAEQAVKERERREEIEDPLANDPINKAKPVNQRKDGKSFMVQSPEAIDVEAESIVEDNGNNNGNNKDKNNAFDAVSAEDIEKIDKEIKEDEIKNMALVKVADATANL